MSTTGPEPPRNGNATEPSRSGRTSGSRWSLVLGALVAFVAAIEAVLKGLSGVLERVNDLFKNAKGLTDTLGLHWSTSWIAIAILGLVGIWLLYLGSRRKSRLLRPEALSIRDDDPSHLRGRDDDVRELAKTCSNRSLVFLVGESARESRR